MRSGRQAWRCGRGVALAAAIGSTSLLPGCGTFSPDGSMHAVKEIVGPELGRDTEALPPSERAAVARAVTSLITRPLTAENAARVALLNNRGLQAAYNALGIAEAV